MRVQKRWASPWAIAGMVAFIPVIACGLTLRGCMTGHSRRGGHGDLAFDVSLDGRRIVFVGVGNGKRDLFLFDRRTGKVEALTNSPDYELAPAFSPDGRRIAFTRGKQGVRADQLCIMDLATRQIEQITDADENITTPAFLPNGQSVVFAAETHYRWGGLASSWYERGALVVLDLKTKDRRAVVEEERRAGSPAVSRDGKLMAWSEGSAVVIASVGESKRRWGAGGQAPAFSPDGTHIAVVIRTNRSDFHVEIVSPKDGARQKVSGTDGAVQVRFLPNGRLLVLREFWRDGYFGSTTRALYECNEDGSGVREVITAGQFESSGLSPR